MILPAWLMNPTHPDSAASMAKDIAAHIEQVAVDAAIANAQGQDVTITPDDIKNHPRLQADVAFHAMRTTAQIAALSDRTLYVLADDVAKRHLYEVSEYETAEAFYREALADTDRSASEASDLRFYAERINPYMQANGIEGAGKVWVKGESVGKARAGRPVLNRLLEKRAKALENKDENSLLQTEQLIGSVLKDITDPGVSKSAFIAKKHGAGQGTEMDGFSGWNYVLPSGSVRVLALMNDGQAHFVENALGEFADWHLGTGDEPILKVIQNKDSNLRV